MKITYFPLRAAVLTVFLSTLGPVGARGQSPAGDNYQISVRSSVEQVYTLFSKKPVPSHGKKLYAIISFEQLTADSAIARPMSPLAQEVNKDALYKQLQKVLAASGFKEPPAGTNPEIVLRVLYGRGWLINPLLKDSPEEAKGTTGDFGGSQTVTMDAQQMALQRSTPGFQEKALAMNAEKLFIAVTAWKFPATPHEKPQQVWQTVMAVDNPDMDLNQVSDKMLAAGAKYFDRSMGFEKVEESFSSRDVSADVVVGSPTVVEPGRADK